MFNSEKIRKTFKNLLETVHIEVTFIIINMMSPRPFFERLCVKKKWLMVRDSSRHIAFGLRQCCMERKKKYLNGVKNHQLFSSITILSKSKF